MYLKHLIIQRIIRLTEPFIPYNVIRKINAKLYLYDYTTYYDENNTPHVNVVNITTVVSFIQRHNSSKNN